MSEKPPKGYPTELSVLGETWKVEYLHELRDDCGEALLGETCERQRVIRLATDQHPDSLRKTFYHEVLHAYHAAIPILEDEKDPAAIEFACELFATVVVDLRRNRELP